MWIALCDALDKAQCLRSRRHAQRWCTHAPLCCTQHPSCLTTAALDSRPVADRPFPTRALAARLLYTEGCSRAIGLPGRLDLQRVVLHPGARAASSMLPCACARGGHAAAAAVQHWPLWLPPPPSPPTGDEQAMWLQFWPTAWCWWFMAMAHAMHKILNRSGTIDSGLQSYHFLVWPFTSMTVAVMMACCGSPGACTDSWGQRQCVRAREREKKEGGAVRRAVAQRRRDKRGRLTGGAFGLDFHH